MYSCPYDYAYVFPWPQRLLYLFTIYYSGVCKKKKDGFREMAKHFRLIGALPKEPGFSPSTHVTDKNV